MTSLALNDRLTPANYEAYEATAGQRDFAADFPVFRDELDQIVGLYVRRERAHVATILSFANGDFEVTGETENSFNARLTLANACQAGDLMQVFGVLPQKRERAQVPGGFVRTDTYEGDVRYLYATTQELRRDVDRALKLPLGEVCEIWPDPYTRRAKRMKFRDDAAAQPDLGEGEDTGGGGGDDNQGPLPYPLHFTSVTADPPAEGAWLMGVHLRFATVFPAALSGSGGEVFFPPAAGETFTATLRKNSTDQDATTGVAVATLSIEDTGDWVYATDGFEGDVGDNLDWYRDVGSDEARGFKGTVIGYVAGDGSGAFVDIVTHGDLDAAVDARIAAGIAAEVATQVAAAIAGLALVQPGTISLWGAAIEDIPDGYLALIEDATFVRADNPVLFAKYGIRWGAGDGVTTAGLPNFQDNYPRGAGDAGDVGDYLLDQGQSHVHGPSGMTTFTGLKPGGLYGHSGGTTATQTATTSAPLDDGVGGGVPRMGDETRPRTIIVDFIVKGG